MKQNLTNYLRFQCCWPIVRDLWSTGFKSSCLVLMAMMLSVGAYAQINVVPSAATCLQNGALSWMAPAGTTAADMISYTITDPSGNTTNLAGNSLSGLTAGDYTVTPFVNNVVGTPETVTIDDAFVPLEIALSTNSVCGFQIEVGVVAGDLASIEVLSGPGSPTVSTDLSTITGVVFPELYELLFTDDCGNTTQIDYTIEFLFETRVSQAVECNLGGNCGEVIINSNAVSPNAGETPFSYEYVLNEGLADESIIVGAQNVNIFDQVAIPFACDAGVLTVKSNITLACGRVISKSVTLNSERSPVFFTAAEECDGCITVRMPYGTGSDATLSFTDFPLGMTGLDNGLQSSSSQCTPTIGADKSFVDYRFCSDAPFITGDYTYTIDDGCCAREGTVSFAASELSGSLLEIYACGDELAAVRGSYSQPLSSVSILSGPDLDADVCLKNDVRRAATPGRFETGPLPLGTYVFEMTDICGEVTTSEITLANIDWSFVPSFTFGCNTFNLLLTQDNPSGDLGSGFSVPYELEWEQSPGVWVVVSSFNGNGAASGLFDNITESGNFRVRRISAQATTCPNCDEIVYTFTENNSGINFNTLEGVQCSDGGSYTINASSTGEPDFAYEIFDAAGMSVGTGTAGSGQNFTFSDLAAGTYTVEASNECGSQIREIELVDLPPITIVGEASYCEGDDVSLSIGGFTFLDFVWTDAAGNVVSTTSTLDIPNVSASDAGTYTVMASFVGNDCFIDMPSFDLVIEENPIFSFVTNGGSIDCDNGQFCLTLRSPIPVASFEPVTVSYDISGVEYMSAITAADATGSPIGGIQNYRVCSDVLPYAAQSMYTLEANSIVLTSANGCEYADDNNSRTIEQFQGQKVVSMIVDVTEVDCGSDASVCFTTIGSNSEDFMLPFTYSINGELFNGVIDGNLDQEPDGRTRKVTIPLTGLTVDTEVALVSSFDNGCTRPYNVSETITINPDTQGCTDPNAPNYDPAATCDDGSCEADPCFGIDPVTPSLTVSSNTLCEGDMLEICVIGEPNATYGVREDGDVSPFAFGLFNTDDNGIACELLDTVGVGSGIFSLINFTIGECTIDYTGITQSVTVFSTFDPNQIQMLVDVTAVDCGADASVCFLTNSDASDSLPEEISFSYSINGEVSEAVIRPVEDDINAPGDNAKVTIVLPELTEDTEIVLLSSIALGNACTNVYTDVSETITIDPNTQGCTDPNAPNYDPAATCDDGSCEDDPCFGINPMTPTLSVSANTLCEGEMLEICVTGEPNSEYGVTEDGDISPFAGAVFRTDASGVDCETFALLGPGSGTFNLVSFREGDCVIRYEDLNISETVTVEPAPDQPSAVNCWDDYQLDTETCTWVNNGAENIIRLTAFPERLDQNCDGDGRFCFTVISALDPASFSPVTVDYVVDGQATPASVLVTGSDFLTQVTQGPNAGYYYKACGQDIYDLAIQDLYQLSSATATDGICTVTDDAGTILRERFSNRPIEQLLVDVSAVPCGGDATVCFIAGGSNSQSYLVEFIYEVNGVPFDETIDGDLDQIGGGDRQKCVTLSNLTETTTINLISSVQTGTCPLFYDFTETITVGSCDPCNNVNNNVQIMVDVTSVVCGGDANLCILTNSDTSDNLVEEITFTYSVNGVVSTGTIRPIDDDINAPGDRAKVTIPLSGLTSDTEVILLSSSSLGSDGSTCTTTYTDISETITITTCEAPTLYGCATIRGEAVLTDCNNTICSGDEVSVTMANENPNVINVTYSYSIVNPNIPGLNIGNYGSTLTSDGVFYKGLEGAFINTGTTTACFPVSISASNADCVGCNAEVSMTIELCVQPEPVLPTNLACNESAVLNSATCSYDIVTDPNAVPGCTDPSASNYDPNATCDDGSCQTSSGCDVFNFEDFENGFGIWLDGGSDCFLNYEPAQGGNASNYCVRTRDNSGVASSLYTKPQDFSCATDIVIDFMYLPLSMEWGEDFYLEYSTDGGSTFTVAQQWVSGVDFINGNFYTESVNIWGSFSNQTVLRFRCDASSNYDEIFLDNISISLCGCSGGGNPGGGNPTCTGAITGYEIISPSDHVLTSVVDGDVLCGDDYSTQWSRVRVSASGDHESMHITVSGPGGTASNIENLETYDSDWFWAEYDGTYTVTAELYSQDHLGGELCDSQTITFTVDDSACSTGGGGSTGGGTGDCFTLYNYEGFETNMGIWNDGGTDCYENYEPASGGNSSNWCMRLRDDTGSNSSFYSDALSFGSVTDIKVDFMYLPESMESGEDFMLEYSTDNGSTWTIAQSWVAGVDFYNNNFYSESVSITGGFSVNTRLRFRCDASSNHDKVYIDEVFVYTCGTVGLVGNDNLQAAVINNAGTDVYGISAGALEIKPRSIEITELRLFPNPTSQILNIEGMGEGVTADILDITGNRIMTKISEAKVDLSTLENGTYLLRTTDGQVKRFLKI